MRTSVLLNWGHGWALGWAAQEATRQPSKGRLGTMGCAFEECIVQVGSLKFCEGFNPYRKGPRKHWSASGGVELGEVRSGGSDAIRFAFQKVHSGCHVENEFLGFENWSFFWGTDCLMTAVAGFRMTWFATWRGNQECMKHQWTWPSGPKMHGVGTAGLTVSTWLWPVLTRPATVYTAARNPFTSFEPLYAWMLSAWRVHINLVSPG